ncbi:tumor-associated calcium signal transducer 2-like isoform X2 [Sphaeramia orbicularis]|uniref:tumor-associated calcium signal transducer 2-like isoform X2 n=1 Tax=Sphaeramia orbicularis TaxID=375764 RepID=UPI00117DEED2|nr:tumor-associated calcium signal transducer 2-like isoform X2 [Sphaeramia orbicularis]
MKIWITLTSAAFAVLASAKCPPCKTMKWANCDGTPCQCLLTVSNTTRLKVDCTKLVPKCFVMMAEMHRAREGQRTHTISGKPHEKYYPDCESDGTFKAKQCNNSEECWCVNSAGIRRTEKGDKNLKCDELVETTISFYLIHKPVSTALDTTTLKTDIADAINERYMNFSTDMMEHPLYIDEERSITLKVMTRNQSNDVVSMAYYMEKDVKGQTLFTNKDEGFKPTVGGQKLEIESIEVNYIDETPPTYRECYCRKRQE